MAKLNGVTVVSEKITYNGVEYAKTDAAAKVGDIVREDRGYSFMPKGEFYEVVDRSGKPVVYDDDGDFFDANSGQVTVFAKVEAVTKPAEDNAEYGKVKAKIGDRIRITDAWGAFGKYANGDEFVVTEVRADGVVYVAEHDRPIAQNEYDVITPAAATDAKLPSDYVIHEGAVYRKESRKADVGEKIIFTRGNSAFEVGEIVTVHHNAKVADDGISYVNGKSGTYGGGKYAVLVPTDTVTIGGGLDGRKVDYGLEKRKADVGESVVVTKTVPNYGPFSVGEIGVTDDKVGWVAEDTHVTFGTGKQYYVGPSASNSEYLVLVPKSSAPAYTEVKRKANVGERIRIVAAEFTMGRYRNGDEYTVTSVKETTGGVRFTAPKGEAFAYQREYVVLVEAKPAPAEQTASSRLKVGDYAKVTEYGARGMESYRKTGDIVRITEVDRSSVPYNTEGLDGKYTGWASVESVVRATDAEVVAAKKQAEEAAETAKWTKIGRKVGEFKAGDIVKIRDNWPAAGVADGEISMIKMVDSDSSGVRLTKNNPKGYPAWVSSEYVTLVAPVESLFN